MMPFLHTIYLEIRHDLIWNLITGRSKPPEEWRAAWSGALLAALTSPNEHLQHNVSIYMLPMVLRLDGIEGLHELLRAVLRPAAAVGATTGQARVSLLLSM